MINRGNYVRKIKCNAAVLAKKTILPQTIHTGKRGKGKAVCSPPQLAEQAPSPFTQVVIKYCMATIL